MTHYPRVYCDAKAVQNLIAQGVDVNLNTRLHEAIKYCDVNAVQDLIAAGADVNSNGNTPLHYICTSSFFECDIDTMLKTLIRAGADVNRCDKYGFTPLHYAACQGRLHLAKTLINAGADINATVDGKTPLQIAQAAQGVDQLFVARFLIRAGADVNRCDK